MATYRKYVCEHKNGDFKTLLLHGDVKHDAPAPRRRLTFREGLCTSSASRRGRWAGSRSIL